MSETQQVLSAIVAVSRVLSEKGIPKARKAPKEAGGYPFRGIDDALAALSPLLPANNLVIVPEILEQQAIERSSPGSKVLFCWNVKVKYHVLSSTDHSSISAIMAGEGFDWSDKGLMKAISNSYKMLVWQLFCVPTTGPVDSEMESHEIQHDPAGDERALQQMAHEILNFIVQRDLPKITTYTMKMGGSIKGKVLPLVQASPIWDKQNPEIQDAIIKRLS